jgi:Family of unknown function (DUF6069)
MLTMNDLVSNLTTHTINLRNTTTLLGAATIALAGWVLSVQVAGVDLIVGSGDTAQTIGPASVAVVPIVAGGAAWALLALLGKRLRNGYRSWRIIAGVVLALSLLAPVSTGAAGGVLATLVAMHLAVGATIIFGLAPRAATPSAGRLSGCAG